MGRTASVAPPGLNVFINCPFDADYTPLLHAIVFAIHDCGFVARTALEEIDSGHTRLDKIVRIIEQCDHGIHDISRTTALPDDWPRFNMPSNAVYSLAPASSEADSTRTSGSWYSTPNRIATAAR